MNKPCGGDFCMSPKDLKMMGQRIEAAERERDELRSRFTRRIVCLCGSTRFYRAFRDFNRRLTLEGIIVLSIGCEVHNDHELGITPEQKVALDDLHKRKIDLADEVFVLDVGGYIGESTRSEIEYATTKGRPIRYLSKEFPDYEEPEDPVARERDEANAACAEIRGALGLTASMVYGGEKMSPQAEAVIQGALSSSAGRDMLERVRQMEGLLGEIVQTPQKMQEMMEREGFVIDNLDDRWQKLAFTLYTKLAAQSSRAKGVLEDVDAYMNPKEGEHK